MDQPGFDVYANEFIPAFLKSISHASIVATEVYSTATQGVDIDYDNFVSTFAGTAFLNPSTSISVPHTPIIKEVRKGDGLSPWNYTHYFHAFLFTETVALRTYQQRFNLYQAPLTFVSADPSGNTFIGKVSVPGIAEHTSRPYVRLGDIVVLRQVFLKKPGVPQTFHILYGRNGQPIHQGYPVPGWNGREHRAVVLGINISQEELTLKVSGPVEPPSTGISPPIFNFCFPVQEAWIKCLWHTVQSVGKIVELISEEETINHWLRKMLFPNPSDGADQKGLNNGFPKRAFYDKQLNFEQSKAVDSIKKRNYGTVPFLISGPPGTGKTKTLVETAVQLCVIESEAPEAREKPRHILMCAPSDPAADTLVSRLKQYFKPSELLRLNSPSRMFASVPNSIMQYTHVNDSHFSIPPIREFLKLKIVVVTCRDAAMLVKARLTNSDLYALEENIISALHPEDFEYRPRSLHWDALLIDEAGQAIEPEALIPLTVIAPTSHAKHIAQPQFVMVGDHKQLGPRTASRSEAIELSLFERLLRRPFYSKHPLARHIIGRTSRVVVLTKSMLPMKRPAFSNLIRNYRSHPAILAIPNSLFYYDTLLAEAADTDSLLSLNVWRGRRWPVLFCCNAGPEELERDGGGWYNLSEITKAATYTQMILAQGLIKQEDICVMSPFQSQVRLLRKEFRKRGLYNVNIGPTEAFQGLESRLVILCTTRSRRRFLEQDKAHGMGIIQEPKRFNVALTRAKQGLIVIGNPQILSCDTDWCSFLDFCRRNMLWVGLESVCDAKVPGEPFDRPLWEAGSQSQVMSDLQPGIPALERILRMEEMGPEERQLGLVAGYDDEMWVKGIDGALPDEEADEEDEDYDIEDEMEDNPHPNGVHEVEKDDVSETEMNMIKPRLRSRSSAKDSRMDK